MRPANPGRTSNHPSGNTDAPETSFAESAMRMAGKSEEEATRTGAIDRADDSVEWLFDEKYQTVNSPIHRAVWDRQFPVELFCPQTSATGQRAAGVMEDALQVIRARVAEGSVLDSEEKISAETLAALSAVGFWGLLVDETYGGSGCSFQAFARFLTRMGMLFPTVAGLASVHGCIGAVDPVRTFGNAEQKARFLPGLASGERLSAFALTEPNAGSDLTALQTRAVRQGEQFLVTGEKLFITNAAPGRTVGLVCLVDERPAVLICELPEREDEHFQFHRYGLWALQHATNLGLRFRDFAIPAENLLQPVRGDGLTIAYHGLNRGRVALCAGAAATMRRMLDSMIPWAQERVTYGQPIVRRELVQRRLGRLAGMIVAADALVHWCGWLIDAGYRGEMECILAKVVGSEMQKEAAVELCLKTHGGRSFLKGHMVGDNLHDYIAPCIYEGESEMLSMAFFKSLVKQHGSQYFEPLGKALQQHGIRRLNPAHPGHLWALRSQLLPYARWWAAEKTRPAPHLPGTGAPAELAALVGWAAGRLQGSAVEISAALRKHQLRIADRQCRMNVLSACVQTLVTVIVTGRHAAQSPSALTRRAGLVYCRELQRKVTGRPTTDGDYRELTELGAAVAEAGGLALES